MRLFNVNGRIVNKTVYKYEIDWDKDSRSKFQKKVKDFLRQHWECYIVYEEFPVFGTKLKVDFYNASKQIAVEAHGSQHEKFNKFFHKSVSGFLSHKKRDAKKSNWLGFNNIKLIEIRYEEIDLLSIDFLINRFNVDIR